MIVDDLGTLVARARELARAGDRAILGLVGAPGGGKSTLAAALTDALGDAAVLVPMDGFHLAQKELVRLGRRDRMGAPDTFDAAGYVALLERLRAARETVYAPEFRRPPEEPIAGVIAVPPDVPLVVTEGNYLLVEDGDWGRVRPQLDEAWYVDMDEATRLELAGRPPRPVRQDAGGGARVGDALRPGQRRGRGGHARARRRDRAPGAVLGDHARADRVASCPRRAG